MSTVELADTRDRVLMAAGPVFAAKGFKEATVREICQRAGVNLAAINYHFGDKERLYIELVKRVHLERTRTAPMPDWPPGTPPERKLLDFVRILLTRMLEQPEAAWQMQLMLREISQPSTATAELVRDYIRPHFALLAGILTELLPPEFPESRRRLIGFSVIGQCLHYRVAQPVIRLLVPESEYVTYGPERLAEHIVTLTLAAIGRGPAISLATSPLSWGGAS